MGLVRGAVFDHGRVPENCPLALMGRFPSLMGRFPTLMGCFPECVNGPFSLLKIPLKTAHEEKGHEEVLEFQGRLEIQNFHPHSNFRRFDPPIPVPAQMLQKCFLACSNA